MSDQTVFQTIQSLKSQIAAETDSDTLVVLYQELVPLLVEPKKRRKDMTPEERIAHRAEVRARRAAGIFLRGGKPMTEEQRAKLKEAWTPERRAAASEKAKGRVQSPETIAKVKAAAEARRNKQAAMEARLKELEAMVAAQNGGAASEAPDNTKGRRR